MTEPCLVLREVSIAFGGVHAVDGVSFDVPVGTIVSLIGPNGAGKTTLLNGISGFVRARGSIRFGDVSLLSLPAHRRAALGIGRTFQNLQLFGSMTLLDNVLAGQHRLLGTNVLLDMAWLPVREREQLARERARALLEQLGIERYAERRAEDLPFGVQKLAGVARALGSHPELLLLDEPAAGLNRQEARSLGSLVTGLRDELGLTVLLVEHNMRLVMNVSDHVIVLDHGRKLAEGAPPQVAEDPEVVAAYLGRTVRADTVEEVRDELAR